jgi:hypothetical protein
MVSAPATSFCSNGEVSLIRIADSDGYDAAGTIEQLEGPMSTASHDFT